MTADEIEQQLAAARERLEAVMLVVREQGFTALGDDLHEYWAAHAEVLRLEREGAAARGEEHAVPVDFPVRWDIGAPMPHLLMSELRAFLTFYVGRPRPSHVSGLEPMGLPEEPLALVELHHCVSARLGDPNDEVLEGHPLSGKGLESYSAQRVVNSRWLAELQAIDSVHRGCDAEGWKRLHHYVLWFHDSTFECIARSFTVEIHQRPLPEVLALACERLRR